MSQIKPQYGRIVPIFQFFNLLLKYPLIYHGDNGGIRNGNELRRKMTTTLYNNNKVYSKIVKQFRSEY